jgi:hypothetical protein
LSHREESIHDKSWAVEIGKARVLKLANQYRDLGYFVIENGDNHAGVDLIIISTPEGRIKKVIEVTNYREPKFFMSSERFERYINSLTYFECIDGIELELVVSYIDNLTTNQVLELKRNHINIRVEGSQDLPKNQRRVD